MRETDAWMPEELAKMMRERIGHWQSYDEAKHHTQEIAVLTQRVNQIIESEDVAHLLPLPPGHKLTDSSNLPDELRTIHHSMKQEIAKIEDAQSQIAQKDAEITRLEKQKNMIIIEVFIIGVIVVVFVAVLILASML